MGARKFYFEDVQKNPRVRKIRVRNSGAGNAFFLQEKPMSVKFLLFGWGGGILGFGGGGVPILFLWARGFF